MAFIVRLHNGSTIILGNAHRQWVWTWMFSNVQHTYATSTKKERKRERKKKRFNWKRMLNVRNVSVELVWMSFSLVLALSLSVQARMSARCFFIFFPSPSSFFRMTIGTSPVHTSLLIWLVNLVLVVVVGLDGAVVLFLSRRRCRLSRTLRKFLAQCHCWPITTATGKNC